MKMLIGFFMLTLSFMGLFHFAGAKEVTSEEEHIQKVHEIVLNYNESFLLSDATGNFRNSTAERFADLFHKNGQQVNFFTNSRNYLMETDINTYIQNMQELYKTYELLRIRSNHEVKKFENIINSHYEAIVRVESALRVWPRELNDPDEQFIYDPEVNVEFDLFLQLDFERENYSITRVQLANPKIVNLSFRLVDINHRTIPSRQTIGFTIINDRDESSITRHRTSDEQGRVVLSNVHRDDMLRIRPPEGKKFIMEEEKTAGEWQNIPENERLLYFQEKQALDKIQKALRTRSQIHVSGSMNFESGFTYRPNQGTEIIGNNANIRRHSFSFLYAYRLLIRDTYELAAGLGAVRTSTEISTAINSIKHERKKFKDVNGHSFELLLESTEIEESFNQISWNIPVFLCFRWVTGLPLIHSFDITTNITHNSNQDISLVAAYQKTAKGYYPEWNCTLEDIPSYGFINDKPEGYTGQIEGNKNTISYGLHIAANTPLFQNKLFLQTSLGYQRTPELGNKNAWSNMIDYNDVPTYDFISSMSVGAYDIGSFTAGFGLMYIF